MPGPSRARTGAPSLRTSQAGRGRSARGASRGIPQGAQPPYLIYNLFPRLLGRMDRWLEWLPRIAGMGFNWVYLNPFHLPGGSGSLYAVKDHYLYHPLFAAGNLDFQAAPAQRAEGERALRRFLEAAHAHGLRVLLDLVVNHTATDAPLVRQHPEWYRWQDGRLVHPGVRDGRKRVVWGDLAQLDHRRGPQLDGLVRHFLEVLGHYFWLGFDGARCDCAQKVPSHFWKALLKGARGYKPDAFFLAEALGCPMREVLRVARAGFDGVFSSFKWWNGQEGWYLDHLNTLGPVVSTVAFPESHDTPRLAAENQANSAHALQRYVLAALSGAGVMMPLGFELGFTRRLNVVRTFPQHLEKPRFDLGRDIAWVNALKRREPIFQREAPVRSLHPTPGVAGFVKEAGGQRAVVVAHLWGEPRDIHLPPELLGRAARVVYGLHQVRSDGLKVQMVPNEVCAIIGEI